MGAYHGYHFSQGHEAYGEKRPFVVGETLTVKGKLELCRHGLHASKLALDALRYASGPIVCKMRLSGQVILDSDKAVATERTVLAMADATRTLHEFVLWCARGVLESERAAGREPDPGSWAALEVKRRWLDGQATDEELAAARAAAARVADDARAAAYTAAARVADDARAAAARVADDARAAAYTAAAHAACANADAYDAAARADTRVAAAPNTKLEGLLEQLFSGAVVEAS